LQSTSSIVGQLRVLVVSTASDIRTAVRAALALEPLLESQIAECERMDAAKAQVMHHGFDLIVIDGSLEDVRWLAVHCPEAAVVFLGRSEEAGADEVVQAGATDAFTPSEYESSPTLLWTSLKQSIRYHAIRQHQKRLTDVLRERDTQLIQLTQKLCRVSPYDYRTGWFNQKQIVERIEEEQHRAKRYRMPLTLVLAEFQGLSDFEAREGAAAAGQVFTQIAQRTRRVVRQTDVAGHFGLDSCVFLLTNTDKPGGSRFCERIHKTMRDPLMVEGERIELTWRFGVAENDLARTIDSQELLRLAQERIEESPSYSPTTTIAVE
jgi:diguanylate cyclase (GGDEF)-like protein